MYRFDSVDGSSNFVVCDPPCGNLFRLDFVSASFSNAVDKVRAATIVAALTRPVI